MAASVGRKSVLACQVFVVFVCLQVSGNAVDGASGVV